MRRIVGRVAIVCLASASLMASAARATSGPCGQSGVLSDASGQTGTCSYAAGTNDTFTVPSGISSVTVDAIGGKGGGGYLGGSGGSGASVGASLSVTPAGQLDLFVAGNGGPGSSSSAGAAGTGGGGAGGCGPDCGGGGGGASFVLSSGATLVVAAGGGGGGGRGGAGGAGGAVGSGGANGTTGCLGGGGATSRGIGAGGNASYANCPASAASADNGPGVDGSLGNGGAGGGSANSGDCAGGGGGGAGYYGGGGGQASGQGQCSAGGGGGGLSYASDPEATFGTDSTGTPEITITWILPSPTLGATVNDFSTSAAWSGSETTGAQAYDVASFGQGETPSGTLYYDFFANGTCTAPSASHEIEPIVSGQPLPTSGGTDNLAAGTYSFQASYSGDSNYHSVTGSCEPFNVAKATPSVGSTVHDFATSNPWSNSEVTGARAYDTATVAASPGIPPTGTVEYSLFSNSQCESVAISTDQQTLASGTVPDSAPTSTLNAGSYSFIADYSGDGNYAVAVGSCEPFTVAHRPSPQNTALPRISGTPVDGHTLTASSGSWSSRGKRTYSYSWGLCSSSGKRCSKIPGATHPSLLLTSADVGHKLTVVVTAVDGDSPPGTASATPVGPVAKPTPPKSTSQPAISGPARVGHTLTTTSGSWSSPDSLRYTYQWSLCSSSGTSCSRIAGATHPSLRLTNGDASHKLIVVVTATDREAQSGHATSRAAGPVTG